MKKHVHICAYLCIFVYIKNISANTLFYVGYNIVTHRIADHHPGRMLPRQRPGHAQASSYHPSSLQPKYIRAYQSQH